VPRQTTIALGILTADYMREFADEPDPAAYTVSLFHGNGRQQVLYFDRLSAVHRLIDEMKLDGVLGEVGLSCAPHEDWHGLFAAITDTRTPTAIN